MATVTSLSLGNRQMQAAVGSFNGRVLRVGKLCEATLPEGCLINGVITNEADFSAAVGAFWKQNDLPRKNVSVTLNSSQFLSRMVTVPLLPPKKLQEIARRELSAMENRQNAITDYMVLGPAEKGRSQVILANSVESGFLESHIALAEGLGLKLCRIDTSMASVLQLLRFLPAPGQETYILMLFDGDNVASILMDSGTYKYSSRNRLFSAHATPEFGNEVTTAISGVAQFQSSSKGAPISSVYFAGCTDADFTACQPGCQMLQLNAALLPDAPKTVQLPAGARLADWARAVGNLLG